MVFRKFVFIIVCFQIGVMLPVSDGYAWEFQMDGSFNYGYKYYMGQGSHGFFGVFNIDRSTGVEGHRPGDYAGVNEWVGRQIGTQANDFASGSDAVKQYQNLELLPMFKITQALSFKAKYRLGAFGDPNNTDYLANTRPGINIATSDGQWTMWWVTAQTPIGRIIVGKRPESFGTGLQFNGASNNTTETVALIAPYGPFQISLAVTPQWLLPPNPDINSEYNFFNILDKNNLRTLSLRFFLTYENGPIDAGVYWAGMRGHAGTESQGAVETTSGSLPGDRATFNPYDTVADWGTFYLKYANGTFFLNSELAYYLEQTNLLTPDVLGPRYKESWRYMLETGLIAGPAKASFLYAFMPGPDRRNGALINKQPFTQGMELGAYDVFRPYSYLLGYSYGSGTDAFDINANGYISDASVLAGRIDYAVAANMNWYASFLWAERTSHGYSWGFLRPAQKAAITRAVDPATAAVVDHIAWTPTLTCRQHEGAPNIPDTALGWEVNAGFSWTLLDRYVLGGSFAYWQPGKWFQYACIDRSVPGWDNQTGNTPSYPFGTNPARSIDPIVGGEISLRMDF